MEKVVYLILARQKDSFNIIYAGECVHTSDEEFFTNNSSFKCWTAQSPSESLYLAILPMFESGNDERKKILDRILARYHPICNHEIKQDAKPEYKIRPKQDLQNPPIEKTSCPCCGSEMKIDKVYENTTLIRCTDCGLSDTKINS